MWWFLAGFLLCCVALLLYLLFAPFFIEIDSETGIFRFRFHRLADGQLVANENGCLLHIRVAWWKKTVDLLQPRKQEPAEAAKASPAKQKQRRKPAPSFHKTRKRIIAVLKSFRIRHCFISIDTGNMPLNGFLYPWFFLLSRQSGQPIQINFWGAEIIQLRLQNSIARMAWALIKSNFKN